MQNSPIAKELLSKNITNPKTTQLILHKINIKEKLIYKKYIKQFFETPQKFFTSNYANKIIIMNKFKSPEKIFELPLPPNLLRRYKARKNKGVQLINDTSMKEQLDDMVSVYNNQTKKKRKTNLEIRKDKEDKRDKRDKREITDEEIQKIFNAFENVRNINKNRIDNFITKNEYVDLIHKNKSYNENYTEKKNDEINEINQIQEKNNINNNNDIKLKKLVKSKSSLAIKTRNEFIKDDSNKKIISAKIVKFNDKINFNFPTKKTNNIDIPKLPTKIIKKSGTFLSIFDENIPQKINLNNKNEENRDNSNNNITTNSQHSTLYKTRNKSFLSNIKNTYNKYLESKSLLNKEQLLLEKQYQYTLDINGNALKKEFAKKLASQEKALNHNKKIGNINNKMMNFLSNKLHKEKDSLILAQVDDYRIMKDIKHKLQNLIELNRPEFNYKWKNHLRNSCDDHHYNKINNNFQKEREIIRNPFSTKCRVNSVEKKFGETEKKYIRNNIRKSDYKKFVKDLSMNNSNFNGLLIEGKNLLKCEKDLIKQIKGKKYLINYNSSLQEKDINDVLYTYNININNHSIQK